jgi:hypothetical protein
MAFLLRVALPDVPGSLGTLASSSTDPTAPQSTTCSWTCPPA